MYHIQKTCTVPKYHNIEIMTNHKSCSIACSIASYHIIGVIDDIIEVMLLIYKNHIYKIILIRINDKR